MSTCKPSGSNTSTKEDGAKKSGSGFFGLFCGAGGKKDADSKKECVDKCPPMPCFNTRDCKPAWLCQPPKPSTKTYPAPKGAKIVPIGKGGRHGTPVSTCGISKCSSCGKVEDKKKSPSVKNKDCPMMKPRCPNQQNTEKKESGFFSKISSYFGSKATAVTELVACSKQDDSVVHNSEISKSTLVVRKDGYFCPLICHCATLSPSVPKLPDLNCDCDDCKAQNACIECEKWAKDTIKSCDKSTELNNKCCDPSKKFVICRPEPDPSPPECPEELECDCSCEEEEEICEEEEEQEVCEEEETCEEEICEEETCEEETCEEETCEEEPQCEEILECDDEPQCDLCCCTEEAPVPESCQLPPPEVICIDYSYEVAPLSFDEPPSVTDEVKCSIPKVPEVICNNPGVPEVKCNNPEVKCMSPNAKTKPVVNPSCPAIRKPKCGSKPPESKVNDLNNLKATPPNVSCKPAYWEVPSGTEGPTGPCADDIPNFSSDSMSFQRPELETALRDKLSCLRPTDTAEILRILQRVPQKQIVPEVVTEMDVTAKAEEMLQTKCTCQLCSPLEIEPPDFLPDPDDRDVSVRAQELLETTCDCAKCNPPLSDEGDPCPVCFPNVTCGECGYIRGENVECCVMCKFAVAMKEEKEYMRNVLCMEPCSLDFEEEECVNVDPEDVDFEYMNGKPVYEGGMSLKRTQKYLWAQGLCDGPGFRDFAIQGNTVRGDTSDPECTCEEHMKKLKYKGGQSFDEVQEWLWIKNKNPTILKVPDDDEQPIDVQPIDVQPIDVQPIDVQPIDEQPIDEQPAEEQPVDK